MVTNCDILIDIDKFDFYQWHKKERNDISIIAAKIKHTFPYGNIQINDDGNFLDITEKPKLTFWQTQDFILLIKRL